MKKQFMALLAAVVMTSCVGAGMLAIGGAAYFNRNGTAAQNSNSAVPVSNTVETQQAAQIAQLQNLVDQYQRRDQQYQDREKQYRDREQQYQQQIDQANSQLQQYQQQFSQVQMLLSLLQQRGIISVHQDGRISIN